MTTTQVVIPDPIQKLFEGHTNLVRSVAFSSDGRWIVSGSLDCTIKIWNVETGECVKTLVNMRNLVTSLRIDFTGRYLVCDTFQKPEGYYEKNESVLEKSRFSLFDFRRPNLGTMHPIEAILSAI